MTTAQDKPRTGEASAAQAAAKLGADSAAPAASPVPVPPKVDGGLFGAILSTVVVGFEILLALLGGVGRGVYLGARRIGDRLLRRKGTFAGRASRFGLFLGLMAAAGFALTLLGMVFLEALDLNP